MMSSSSSSSPPRRMGSLMARRSNEDLSLPLHCDTSSSSQSPTGLDDSASCSSSSSSLGNGSHHSTSSTSTRRRRSHHHRRPSPTDLWASEDSKDELSLPTKCPSLNKSPSTTSRRSSSSHHIGAFVLGGLFFCGIWIGCCVLVMTYLEAHDQVVRDAVRQAEILPLEKDLQRKVSHLQHDNKFLQHRLEGLEHERQQQQASSELHEHIQRLDKESTGYKQSIQKLSKYALHERFGESHHVEIQLAFDPAAASSSGDDTSSAVKDNKIILELAKADEMPHSVFWFLEQVTRGLYDGTSIHRSAKHVVQGGPHTNFMTTPTASVDESSSNNALYSRFERSGFEKVLMQESNNESWAHQPYTIGYAAGGPDFYFNMLDNARVHGPRGHGDPCFAKVISGFELVDRIHQSPVQPGAYHALQHNVAIVSMRLMEQNEPILLQLQQSEQQQQAATAQA